MFLACTAAYAETYVDEDEFFSYKRFFLNQSLVDKIPADGKVQSDLNRFAVSFTDGLYAISAGQMEKAKKDLSKARDIWPEYFAVDFLLARIYEDQGDYKTAARYYKSYLNKLKHFYSGGYRISEPLIRSLTSYGIEKYGPAHELVEKRLAYYGINLDRVRPIFTFPTFLLFLLAFASVAGIYIVFYYWLMPYLKKQHRINNPPEGFWICRFCDTANPELRKECEECKRPRE